MVGLWELCRQTHHTRKLSPTQPPLTFDPPDPLARAASQRRAGARPARAARGRRSRRPASRPAWPATRGCRRSCGSAVLVVDRVDRAPSPAARFAPPPQGPERHARLVAGRRRRQALAHVAGGVLGRQRARREAHAADAAAPTGRRERSASRPRPQSQATRYQRRPALTSECGSTSRRVSASSRPRVGEAQALLIATGRGDDREVWASTCGPPRGAGWSSPSAARVRAGAGGTGSTCSSFTSARTEVSSIPATEPPAAVRSPTAMAIASSSSSSSGGIAVPARSDSRPPAPSSTRPDIPAHAAAPRRAGSCARTRRGGRLARRPASRGGPGGATAASAAGWRWSRRS